MKANNSSEEAPWFICIVNASSFILHPSSFELLRYCRSFLHSLFDCANHVEGLLRQIVVLALNDLAEALDCIFQLYIFAFQAGELRRHKEWLREEPLNLARARNDQLIFVRQFIQTQNRDDVLQVFVT